MKKEDKQVEINLGFVEKVNDFLRGLGKTSVLFFAIITIVTIVLVVLYINIFFGAAIERQKYEKMSVEEKVEKIYSEKFEIVSENFVNDKKVYKMNPVKNEEIEFTVVDNKSSIAEDYWTNRLKYEVENMDDKNLYNELRKEEYWNEDRGAKMLSYFAFWIEIENYADIEESVRKMYNLNEMLEEKIGRKTNLSECIRKGDYKSEIVYWRNDDIDEIIYNEKYEYINYLKENNLQDKTLSEDEINNIWRPKELEIIVNGNKLKPAFNRDNNYLARYNKK